MARAARAVAWAIVAATVVAAVSPASAQPARAVLRESQVTERRLLDALDPPEPAGGPRARSIVASPSADVLITFATDSAELTPSARRALDTVARTLAASRLAGRRILIEGHADPRGGDEHNVPLSRARAESVRRYLVEVGNVDPGRLQVEGKGSKQLLNTRDETAPENRRVTFVATR